MLLDICHTLESKFRWNTRRSNPVPPCLSARSEFWPQDHFKERQETARSGISFPPDKQLELKNGLPNIIGAIDYIWINPPPIHPFPFLSGKRYHSINVQIISDANCHILNVLTHRPWLLCTAEQLSGEAPESSRWIWVTHRSVSYSSVNNRQTWSIFLINRRLILSRVSEGAGAYVMVASPSHLTCLKLNFIPNLYTIPIT